MIVRLAFVVFSAFSYAPDASLSLFAIRCWLLLISDEVRLHEWCDNEERRITRVQHEKPDFSRVQQRCA